MKALLPALLLSYALYAATAPDKEKRDPILDPDGHLIEFSTATKGEPVKKQIGNHLLHVGMGTSDLRAASEFYRDHFGFRDVWRGPTPTAFRIDMMRAPASNGHWVINMSGPNGLRVEFMEPVAQAFSPVFFARVTL
jgi:hypothetical protein